MCVNSSWEKEMEKNEEKKRGEWKEADVRGTLEITRLRAREVYAHRKRLASWGAQDGPEIGKNSHSPPPPPLR